MAIVKTKSKIDSKKVINCKEKTISSKILNPEIKDLVKFTHTENNIDFNIVLLKKNNNIVNVHLVLKDNNVILDMTTLFNPSFQFHLPEIAVHYVIQELKTRLSKLITVIENSVSIVDMIEKKGL